MGGRGGAYEPKSGALEGDGEEQHLHSINNTEAEKPEALASHISGCLDGWVMVVQDGVLSTRRAPSFDMPAGRLKKPT